MFKDSPLTLGEIGDACVYFGDGAAVGATGTDRRPTGGLVLNDLRQALRALSDTDSVTEGS